MMRACSRLRTETLANAIQPSLSAAQLLVQPAFQPMFAQITERQRDWANALAVPLIEYFPSCPGSLARW